ncbi:MAG TPA: hypothetical protein VK327_12805 [Candidatus Paceibacterota bacterium]|nr:hypothetical protein [Candidatus Paceibacterota bacterium]
MGLRIMRSRAGTIGGALTVENLPEGGVGVTCVVALGGDAVQNTVESGRKKQKPKREKTDTHR